MSRIPASLLSDLVEKTLARENVGGIFHRSPGAGVDRRLDSAPFGAQVRNGIRIVVAAPGIHVRRVDRVGIERTEHREMERREAVLPGDKSARFVEPRLDVDAPRRMQPVVEEVVFA
jgi:hypothetical protein